MRRGKLFLVLLMSLVTLPLLANDGDTEFTRPVHFRSMIGTSVGYVERSFLQSVGDIVWSSDGRLFGVDALGGQIIVTSTDGTISALELWQRSNVDISGLRGLSLYDGTLWFNTVSHVYAYDIVADEIVHALRLDDAGSIGDVVVSDNGTVYFSTRDRNGAIWQLDAERGIRTRLVEDVPFAEFMAFGDDGTLYVSQMGQDSIVAINLRLSRQSEFFRGNFGGESIYLAVSPDGHVWARGDNSLYQLSRNGEPIPYTVPSGTYDGAWQTLSTGAGIAFDDEGLLWVASRDARIWRIGFAESGVAVYTVQSTRSSINIRACPQTTCAVVTTLMGGDIVPVVETVRGEAFAGSADWYRFNHEGEEAFIHSSLVDVEAPQGGILQLMVSGVQWRDLLMADDGTLYAYDAYSQQIIAWTPQFEEVTHETPPFVRTGYERRVVTAIDAEGDVLLALAPSGALLAGLPDGDIVRLSDNRTLLTMSVVSMTFAEDGLLYLITYDDDEHVILQYDTALNQQTEIHRLRVDDEIQIFDAGNERLWLIFVRGRHAEIINLEGQVLEALDLPDRSDSTMVVYANARGELYFAPHHTGNLWRYTSLGWQEIGEGFGSGAQAIAVNTDEGILYIAEAGSIGRLILRR